MCYRLYIHIFESSQVLIALKSDAIINLIEEIMKEKMHVIIFEKSIKLRWAVQRGFLCFRARTFEKTSVLL